MTSGQTKYMRLDERQVPQFRQLINLFGNVFEEPKTYIENQPRDDYLLSLLKTDTFIAIAAVKDERIIGGLVAYELKKFEQMRSETYIYDLAVDERYRRQGVAKSCIGKLQEICKENRSWVIFVQADNDDEPAIKLYESLGTKENVLHFDISPDKEQQ